MLRNKKIKWLIYTVIVGLIPFIARLIILVVSTDRDLQNLISAPDFLAFGLILHISNINVLEHIQYEDKDWITKQNGTSTIFILFIGLLYAISLIADTNPGIFEIWAINTVAIILSAVSFFLSYSVYDRLSNMQLGEEV